MSLLQTTYSCAFSPACFPQKIRLLWRRHFLLLIPYLYIQSFENRSYFFFVLWKMFKHILLLILTLLSISLFDTLEISCLDENLEKVDGWTAIKVPNSYNYYVFDDVQKSWILSKYLVNQTSLGCIMGTASLFFGDNSVFTQAFPTLAGFYNDEPPTGQSVSSSYAHAKGFLAASESNGALWLTHSMPSWPNMLTNSTPGDFPSNTYGQSLQCVTVSSSTADLIASNLIIDHTFIYSIELSNAIAGSYSNTITSSCYLYITSKNTK